MPPLDDELPAAYDASHARLGAAFNDASAEVRMLFTFLQRRLVAESLAYLQPVEAAPRPPLMFPPPRAALTLAQQLRLQGARSAFRYLDSRSTMVRDGAIPTVVTVSTPHVLHALLEGPCPSSRETNAGMLRATPTAWKPEANSFMHPPAGMCEELVAAAVDLATTAPAHPCARAGWLTFAMLSIHPFVDGNGRTSRALFLAVSQEHLPLGVDWAVLDMWSYSRGAYVTALQAGQQVDRYTPEQMDARPFMTYAARTSADGAEMCIERIEALAAMHDHARTSIGLSPWAAAVWIAVRLHRSATPLELTDLGLPAQSIDDAIAELGSRGLLAWSARPHLRRTIADPSRTALVAAGRMP